MEKDLLIGPVAVGAVTHSSLYWPVGQEEDLGTMARSWGEERMKDAVVMGDAVVRGRRKDSPARRRFCRCMSLAGLFICSLYQCLPLAVRVLRRYLYLYLPNSRNPKPKN